MNERSFRQLPPPGGLDPPTEGGLSGGVKRWTLGALALLAACGGGETVVRPVVPREDPEKHLLRIGTLWEERSLDEGFLENDPQGISFFRVETVLKIKLEGGGKASEAIERIELFRMRSGGEFHCEARGTVDARAVYSRAGDELRVAIENGEAALPRSCREPGFPVPGKNVSRGNTVFALRAERLVAIDPPRSRAVLLPLQ
jgi:hypothetical protein